MTDKDKLTARFEKLIADADFESDGWQSTYTFETVKQLMHSAYDLDRDNWVSEMDKARFWIKVNQTDYCWEWSAHKNKNGYGIFSLKKSEKRMLAHRVSYQLINGVIPDGILVCHHCDNPKCVNPSHLFLGTHQDNMLDMYAKGRGRIQGRTSKFLGVGWRKDILKWFAYIRLDGKIKRLGQFNSEDEANCFRLNYIIENNLTAVFENSNTFNLPSPPINQTTK